MPTTDYRYAAPTAAPQIVSQARFESLARGRAEGWSPAIVGTMLALYRVEGCNKDLFSAGKVAAGKFRDGEVLTPDDKLAIGRAIVDHHLTQQHKKGLVVYQREVAVNA